MNKYSLHHLCAGANRSDFHAPFGRRAEASERQVQIPGAKFFYILPGKVTTLERTKRFIHSHPSEYFPVLNVFYLKKYNPCAVR